VPDELVPDQAEIPAAGTPAPPVGTEAGTGPARVAPPAGAAEPRAETAIRPDQPISRAREALGAARARARAQGLQPAPRPRLGSGSSPANGDISGGTASPVSGPASPADRDGAGGRESDGLVSGLTTGETASPLGTATAPVAAGQGADTATRDFGSARRARRPPVRPGFPAVPQRDDPQPLSRAIGGLLDAEGWTVAAATGSVFGRWAQIVGADLAAHTTPETLTDGELTVAADSTAWATQVRLLAAQLVRRLNAELGDGSVVRVRVRGPGTGARKPGEWRVRGGRGPRDTYG